MIGESVQTKISNLLSLLTQQNRSIPILSSEILQNMTVQKRCDEVQHSDLHQSSSSLSAFLVDFQYLQIKIKTVSDIVNLTKFFTFSSFNKLSHLQLMGITGLQFLTVTQFSVLRYLQISNCYFTNLNPLNKASLPSLQHLNLSNSLGIVKSQLNRFRNSKVMALTKIKKGKSKKILFTFEADQEQNTFIYDMSFICKMEALKNKQNQIRLFSGKRICQPKIRQKLTGLIHIKYQQLYIEMFI